MTRSSKVDLAALRAAAKDNVITSAQLREAGLSANAIANRCRPGGPWRRLLPSVILLGNSAPTRQQLVRAALEQSGQDAVVTGVDALRAYGIKLPPPRQVRVLVPVNRRLLPHEFMDLERTSRMPEPVVRNDVTYAPPERAALDAARRETDLERLQQLLTLPIYYGLCTEAQLHAELDAGNQRGSSAVRDALRQIGPVSDTYLHGVARQLLGAAALPPPAWNVTVCDRRGQAIGAVDAWWDEVAMGWQFTDTHEQSESHMAHLGLTAASVVMLRTSPTKLANQPRLVLRELAQSFAVAVKRKRPRIVARRNLLAAS